MLCFAKRRKGKARVATCQTPHCKPKVIDEFFGTAGNTGQNKSKEVREILKMGPFSHEWALPSRFARNTTLWILQVNGLMVDIRQLPLEVQQMAFEKGLIPYVPAQKQDQSQ